MGSFRQLLRHTFAAHLWRQAKSYHFKHHVLPRQTEVELDGVRLDISTLSPPMKEVIMSGKYELAETTLCRQIIRPGDRILELGGAIGYVGLFCLRNLQVAEFVSAEPNPHTASILRRNYALNGLQPNLEEVAISDRDGTINLCVSDEFWGDNAFVSYDSTSRSELKVEAWTVRSLLQKRKSDFTVLIADIEGAETLINWNDIPPSVSRIIIEIHPGIVGFSSAYGALHRIMNLGFLVEARMNDVIALRRKPDSDRPAA